ncbi:MAG: Rieske 2Fe-2S domain-containing protein [Candidatus Nanopelagicales bacterium]
MKPDAIPTPQPNGAVVAAGPDDHAPADHASADDASAGHAPEFAPVDWEHHVRRTDVDPRAARRAARTVALLFVASMLFAVLAIVAYVAIPIDAVLQIPLVGGLGFMNVALGVTIGASILCIGLGAIHWARKLMSAQEWVAARHPSSSTKPERQEAIAAFERGVEDSGFAKYPIIRRTLLAALVLMPLPLIVLLRGLWVTPGKTPSPSGILRNTIWRGDIRILTDVALRPIRPDEVPVGNLVAAVPANLEEVEHETGDLNARAKAAIILVRMAPEDIVSQQGEGWDFQGILAFSKICTHVGCPIALYEQRTHHLLCPCHQSTFDLADSGNVVFGPAARRMPQLPIKLDAEGYLVAVSDFQEPVGPSFWERG